MFTLLGEFIMPWLMLLLAPGFADDPAKFDLAVLLARIALPFLLCMSLVALYSGVLNALGRFAVAAFAPSLLNVVLIAVLLTLIAIGDVEQSTAAVALAWGIAASGVLQVIVVAVAAAKSKMRLSFRLPRFDADMQAPRRCPPPLRGTDAQVPADSRATTPWRACRDTACGTIRRGFRRRRGRSLRHARTGSPLRLSGRHRRGRICGCASYLQGQAR